MKRERPEDASPPSRRLRRPHVSAERDISAERVIHVDFVVSKPHPGRERLLALVAALALLAFPAAAQDSPPPRPAVDRYVELCGMCHRAGGMGTGLLARRLPSERAELEKRDDLTPEYVATVVRTGVGNMPPLSRAEVSEDALAAIAAYLAAGPHDEEGEP